MGNLAPRPGSSSIASPRALELHWGTSTQRIKFYPHGSLEDLLAGIRGVMGVAEDAPLRFRDAEGDIVLLAPAGMPDGTVLHAAVERGVPFQGTVASAPTLPPPTPNPKTAPAADPSWRRWSRVSNVSLSKDNLGFEVNQGDKEWAAYTPVLPTSGQHYFVIDFPSHRHCCLAIGLIPASLSSLAGRWPITDTELPAMIAVKGLGLGPEKAGDHFTGGNPAPLVVGVYLDADARRVVFVPHDDPQNDARAIRIDNIPLPAVFAVYGPKHDCKAVIRPGVGMPAQGVYTGPKALFVKQGR